MCHWRPINTFKSLFGRQLLLTKMSGGREELFRMSLPEECISFYSEEGKTIFSEALATGHMNCYFKLAAQFRTQDEPDYCGLSTLVMILNALNVDPGVVWKGPWRWYHENMLNCSTPRPKGKRRTISMEQFASVADCNSLYASIVHTNSNSEEDFRQIIREQTLQDDSFVVASYSREPLQQIGDVDFSPISGYHPTKDYVLLLDTARFKYPPYWIKLPFLLQAMNATDISTDRSRGYIILRKKLDPRLFLFRTIHILPTNPSEIPPDVLSFLQQWTSYLRDETDPTPNAIPKTIDKFLSLVTTLKPEHMLLTLHNAEHTCLDKVSKEYGQELLQQVENTHVFRRISRKMKSINSGNSLLRTENGSNERINKVKMRRGRPFRLEHVLTVLLLSWPFCCTYQSRKDQVCVSRILKDYIRQQFLVLADPLTTEVVSLSHQLSVRLHLINLGI